MAPVQFAERSLVAGAHAIGELLIRFHRRFTSNLH